MFNPFLSYKKVRENLNKFVIRLGKSLDQLYSAVVSKVTKGGSVESAVTDSISGTKFSEVLKKETEDVIVNTAKVGFGTEAALTKTSEDTIRNKLTGYLWSPDKMNLSHRLHTAQGEVRNNIAAIISAGIRNADTIKDIARKLYNGYDNGKGVLRQTELPKYLSEIESQALAVRSSPSYGIGHDEIKKKMNRLLGDVALIRGNVDRLQTPELRAAYQNLLKVCTSKELNQAIIQRAAWVAVQERTRYYAMRIARTETARAWFDGFLAKHQNDPEVWGYQWQLSSRHNQVPFDQCDVCANINVGYGKGKYPKNKVPTIPRHPHCMCMLSPVYVWEVDSVSTFDPSKAIEYIAGVSDADQVKLFGRDNIARFKQGGDWQKLLRGWDGFSDPKSRLSKEDFN